MRNINSRAVAGLPCPIAGTREADMTMRLSVAAKNLIRMSACVWVLALALPTVATSAVNISLKPPAAALTASETQQFTATIAGASNRQVRPYVRAKTANRSVTWTLNPRVGTISGTGLYTAPSIIAAAQVVTMTVTSVDDPTVSTSAKIMLAPAVTISLTPLSATLTPSETQQFTANVIGPLNTAVTWTVTPAVGTISDEGLYTAPATVAAGQMVTVNVTSAADPTKSANATLRLSRRTTTLREAAAQRAILIGAAASADELPWVPSPLKEPAYGATLGAQYGMLSPENALKWIPLHPEQSTYNFGPADQLVAFAQAHGMKIRGHTLCWYSNPDWLNNMAKTASPSTMLQVLRDHITTVVTRYRGQIFAWDVVNEAISDAGTGMRDSIWYNQPGTGLTGTGYVEQALRWAHAADPNALLFYNEYGVEDAGPKFQAMYNMVKDFMLRGVPLHGVGLQMHIDNNGYPSTAGLTENIQRLTALGLQVHITEMDVRVPVDANGNPSTADLEAQAQTYKRILTICLQNPGCTAFQTWGFSDKQSWIPYFFPGFGAALPFDTNYQPKGALDAMIDALQGVPR